MGHRRAVNTHAKADDLERLFDSANVLAIKVYDAIASDPKREWHPDELVDMTGAKIVDVMMILARLTAAELVRHDGLGTGHLASAQPSPQPSAPAGRSD